MRVTKIGPKAIKSAPLSAYEMACQIRRFIERQSLAVLIGHNSISFDESMLRQMDFLLSVAASSVPRMCSAFVPCPKAMRSNIFR
jgi:hypothetical protein